MIHYYKDTPEGRIWYSGSIKLSNGIWQSNPTVETLLSEGWISVEPELPSLYIGDEPLPEDVSLKKLFEKHPESRSIVNLIQTGFVYHYSTWDVLFKGILSSDNISNGHAVLRAYSVRYMNDSSEGLLVPRGLSNAEGRRLEGEEVVLLSKSGERIRRPATEHPFYKEWKEKKEYSASKERQKLFSVSFSREPDSLPMWNYYGHGGCGLSIGFDAHHIVNQGYDIIECVYDKSLIDVLSDYLYDSCYWASDHQPLTIALSLISKDPHFQYEKECRIPLRQHYGQCCITKRNQFHPIKYDIKKGVISPFVEVYVPIEAIREIWIGPTNDIDLAEDSLRGWLNSVGMSWVRIKKSLAPLR